MFYTRQNFPVCRCLNVQSCKLIKKIKYLKRIKKMIKGSTVIPKVTYPDTQ